MIRQALAWTTSQPALVASAVLLTLVIAGVPPRSARALHPAGIDVLSAAGQVSVESRLGAETIPLSGTVTIQRSDPRIEGSVEVVDAVIVAISLSGTSLTGPIAVAESATRTSSGEIRSLQTGQQFPASSFFDVFVDVEIPVAGFRSSPIVHNEEPLHLVPTSGGIEVPLDAWPPVAVTYQAEPQPCVPLLPALPAEICIVSIAVTLYVDTDGDGCTDVAELQTAAGSEVSGGRRDPTNPWDFYDANGDKGINIFDDILPVANAFGPSTGPDYDPSLDRSPPPSEETEPDPSKREPWDLGPPDGVINIFDDIFGVANQFGHSCTAAAP